MLSVHDATMRVADRTLWSGLNIELVAGERLVIAGGSGSGKTLLLRAVAGLDAFTAGGCEFRGRRPEEWPMPAYRAQVMYIPQRAALASMTVRDALAAPFALAIHKGKRFEASVAARLLETLGRPASLLDSQTATLSGGELGSVLLVRALLLTPSVLLLDEVTAALDPALAERAEQVVTDWVAAGDRALLWVGHDPAGQRRIGTRVLTIAADQEPAA